MAEVATPKKTRKSSLAIVTLLQENDEEEGPFFLVCGVFFP